MLSCDVSTCSNHVNYLTITCHLIISNDNDFKNKRTTECPWQLCHGVLYIHWEGLLSVPGLHPKLLGFVAECVQQKKPSWKNDHDGHMRRVHIHVPLHEWGRHQSSQERLMSSRGDIKCISWSGRHHLWMCMGFCSCILCNLCQESCEGVRGRHGQKNGLNWGVSLTLRWKYSQRNNPLFMSMTQWWHTFFLVWTPYRMCTQKW